MRIPVRITLVLCIAILGRSASAIAQASTPPATAPAVDSIKLQLIRAILTETHGVDLMVQSIEAAAPAQRAANPAIPAAFWDRFLTATRERKDELGAFVTQIYDRHFTANELRQLLAFYRTPIGRKLLAEQPAVMQESIVAGQQWGQRLGFEIGQQLAAEAQKAP